MNPLELAKNLRRIACGIDQSKNPRRDLVARDLKKVLAAVGGLNNLIEIQVSEDPNIIEVKYKNQVHSASWSTDDESGDGALDNVNGDINLLQAAMIAWDGKPKFSLTENELTEMGGGWWSPQVLAADGICRGS